MFIVIYMKTYFRIRPLNNNSLGNKTLCLMLIGFINIFNFKTINKYKI